MKLTSDEIVKRGQRAGVLLEDPLVKEVLDAIERSCIERWERAKTPEERDKEWGLRHAAKSFREAFNMMLARGVQVTSQGKKENERISRWRDRFGRSA